jgi:hypothetical protein
MGTYPQVPLTHCLECRHLLDVVWVEVLQLEAVLVEDPPDEPPGGDGEAAPVEGHERDHTAPGGRDTNSSPGTFHSTAAVSGGSCPASTRRCSWSRDTLDRVQFDMAAARSRVNLRYGSGSVAGARKQEKRGTRVEEDDEGVKSQFRARCAVKKGKSAVVRLECRARRVSGTSAHVRVPRRNRHPPAQRLDSHKARDSESPTHGHFKPLRPS